MIRLFNLILIVFVIQVTISIQCYAFAPKFAGGNVVSSSYQGPCDILSGGCNEAYSMTHALTVNYSGPLFQLVRSSDGTTLNVPQTSNHTANLSVIPAFCYTTVNSPIYCYVQKVFAQINTGGNNDLPAFGYAGTVCQPSSCIEHPLTFNCSPTIFTNISSCVSPFWIDPSSGLPLLATEWPAEYINDNTLTGINANNDPITILTSQHDDQWNEGGGVTLSHPTTYDYPEGSMFGTTVNYNATNYTVYQTCGTPAVTGGTPPNACLTIENELGFGIAPQYWNQAPYGMPGTRRDFAIEWDGAPAIVQASVSTDILDVTSVMAGTITAGAVIQDYHYGYIPSGTTIEPFGTGGTSGTGGTGTYELSTTPGTVATEGMATANTSGSQTNSVWGFVGGSQIFNNQPPNIQLPTVMPSRPTAFGPQFPHLHYGGGDGTAAIVLSQDTMLLNYIPTSSQVASVHTNESAFYAAQTPNACQSTGDPGYFLRPQEQSEGTELPISQTVGAWGLRQMTASQTGPIADLQGINSPNTVETFGPAMSGCGIDPNAVTFCSANGGCSVKRLYNQEWYSTAPTSSTQGVINVHDPILDMTASSMAAQPSVTFNSLNGQPTMHFSGAQELCTSAMPVDFASAVQYPQLATPFGVGASMAVVARRTGALTTAAEIFETFADATYLGSAASANTANIVGDNTAQTLTAADNSWHEFYAEQESTVTNQAYTFTPYIDGVAGTTNTYGSFKVFSGNACLGGASAGGNYFTGDIAEATISGSLAAGSILSKTTSIEPTIFSLEEAAWGNLPH